MNRLYVEETFLRYPQNDEALNLSGAGPLDAASKIFEGASVVMGGVIANDLSTHTTTRLLVDWGSAIDYKGDMRSAMQECLGLNYPITGERGTTEHLGMGCLQWDVFNEWGQDNNRQLKCVINKGFNTIHLNK